MMAVQTLKLKQMACVMLIDLAIDFELDKQYDWVLSLEVGEHIPAKYFDAFIKNLCKHCNQRVLF